MLTTSSRGCYKETATVEFQPDVRPLTALFALTDFPLVLGFPFRRHYAYMHARIWRRCFDFEMATFSSWAYMYIWGTLRV